MLRRGGTELYKKHLHDPDNHDGMTTHLEPDILEYEVKWDLRSITTKKKKKKKKLMEVMDSSFS